MNKLTGNAKTIKIINRSLILQAIRKHGPVTRTDLVKLTKLTSGTISNLTAELLKANIIKEVGTGKSIGGRRPLYLAINSNAWHVVGVNIGNTKVVSVVTDLEAKVACRVDGKLNRAWDAEQQVAEVCRLIKKAIAESGLPRHSFLGIGVGVPGFVNTKAGKAVFSPNLGWKDLPVRELIQARVGLPVLLENSVRLGTLGEKWWGKGQGKENVITMYIGTGVGAGLILGDKLYRGTDEAAGEIGHIMVADTGQRCSCGKYGCLEAVASGPAIVRHASRLIQQGVSTKLIDMCQGDLNAITGEMIDQAAWEGDEVAREVLTQAGRYLGQGIAILATLFNPDIIILNGGVSNAHPILLPVIREVTEKQLLVPVKVEVSELGDMAGPLGGAALVIEGLFTISGIEWVTPIS